MVDKIITLSKELMVSEIGFSKVEPINDFKNLDNAITIVIKLSKAVINGITDKPTHTYFHHYRSVNTLIDQITLKIGLLLDSCGYEYTQIPASQTVDRGEYKGLFSHKLAAVNSGLGFIGKNALFISERFGPAVRLGTVLTNCDLSKGYKKGLVKDCGSCKKCMVLCPAMAISGENFDYNNKEKKLIDVKACSDYMKKEFQLIGRGSVCGICIKNCMYNNPKRD